MLFLNKLGRQDDSPAYTALLENLVDLIGNRCTELVRVGTGEFQNFFRQFSERTVEAHEGLTELCSLRNVSWRLTFCNELFVEHRPVQIAMLLAAFILLVPEPGSLLEGQVEMDFCKQFVQYPVFHAGLNSSPAVANDVTTRESWVRNDVNRIVLTLIPQVFGTLQNHLGRVDLTRRKRIGIN